MSNLAGIGKTGREKLSKVLESNPRIVNSEIVSSVLNITNAEANKLLSRWCKNAWLYRVRRGVYLPVPIDSTSNEIAIEEPFLVADFIFGSGYVGGFSAVKYWDLSEQILETTYYFTTKKTKNRDVDLNSMRIKVKTIKEYKYFGTKPIWIGNNKVNVSNATKTLVDLLDDPKLAGGMTIVYEIFQEYAKSEYCDYSQLLEYSERMQNGTILKRLGFMLETKLTCLPKELKVIREKLPSGYSSFDPSVESRFTNESWKLRIPLSWKLENDRKNRNLKNS